MQDHELWSYLTGNPGVTSITIALPPYIFKRLEQALLAQPDLAAVLAKVAIVAVEVPRAQRQLAFALFDDERGEDRDFCYVFPKIDPFARLDPSYTAEDHWVYDHFLVLKNLGLRERFAHIADSACEDTPSFTIDEMLEFVRGDPTTLEKVLHDHGYEDARRRLLSHYSTAPGSVRCTSQGRVLDIRHGYRTCQVHCGAHASGTPKPIALWLPPWGRPRWRKNVEPIDNHLRQWFRVMHLKYEDMTRKYSFTMAEQNAADAIAAIRVRALELNANADRIVLIAVSVNAFIAAALAAQDSRITALCLLNPAMDLFDAIDAFRRRINNISLFSRLVYFGKQNYTAPELSTEHLRYFGSRINADHLVDLRVRGAARCRESYFLRCVDEVTGRGRRVFIGYSRLDEMTDYRRIELAFKEDEHVMLEEIEWHHRIGAELEEYDFDAEWKSPRNDGIRTAVKFLEAVGRDLASDARG